MLKYIIKTVLIFPCLWVSGAVFSDSGLHYDCLVEPSVTSEVSSAVSGIVEDVKVDRGDHVKEGDILVTLKSGVQKAAVKLAEERSKAIAELKSRKARMEFAKRIKERNSELYETSILSLQAMDQAESDAVIAQLLLSEAYENKRIAKLELEQAREVLEMRTIRSPITGIVVEKMISTGELVDEDPIIRIAQIDPLNVEVVISSNDIKRIHRGMTVKVTLAPPIDGTYDAEIHIVDKVIDAASGTFGVRAILPNPENELPAGIQCTIVFESRESID